MATPFQLIVVTPETTALDKSVEYVSIPAIDGEMGIMASHAPVIARLGYGELRFESGGKTERFYVDGGFAQVAGNVVSVLTGGATPVGKLDEAEVRKRLEEAETHRGQTEAEESQRQRTLAQSRAQLRMLAKH